MGVVLLLAACSFESAPAVGSDRLAASDTPAASADAGAVAPGSVAGGETNGETSGETSGKTSGETGGGAMATDGGEPKPPEDSADAGSPARDDAGPALPADVGDSGALIPPASACEPDPSCQCAHGRAETPSDACAPPDCALDTCAPDDGCRLERFGASVYYFCAELRTQAEARERCEQIEGMHLVEVGSEGEDAFLLQTLDDKAWIGAELDGDSIWRWQDGTAFYDGDSNEPVAGAYVNWAEGDPNGLGLGDGDVDCAIYWHENAGWADTNCDADNGYICEREF